MGDRQEIKAELDYKDMLRAIAVLIESQKEEIYGLFCPGFPAVNGVSLGREVDAEFYDLLAGCEKRLVVAFFLYLLESDFGRLVALELYYIDIFVGIEDDVYAAAGGVILRLDI